MLTPTVHVADCGRTAVRHKAPIKYCLHCGKRNHAHSKKCNTCGEGLPIKEKPPKRKHESLSMKHYEDTIINKVRGGSVRKCRLHAKLPRVPFAAGAVSHCCTRLRR